MTKVLVVENDQAVRDVLTFSLTKAGYEVLLAENGEKALGAASMADVILLDLHLPRLAGEDFLKIIRKDGNYTPVVVVSGVYPKAEAEKRLKGLDIVDFVEKPFSMREIEEKILKGVKIAKDIKDIRRSTDRLGSFLKRQAALQ